MELPIKRRKRSIIKRFLIGQYKLFETIFSLSKVNLSIYIKCVVLILILYYLNLLLGFKYYIWSEKSFENEYYSKMIHIDVTKVENSPEQILGPPNNIITNQFIIKNEFFCGRSRDPETLIYPHLLILVKSSFQNSKERQAIRLTWGQKRNLYKKNIRLAFFLGIDTHNKSVEDESKKYGDIIQIDKVDNYYSSSHKMIMMLRWITDYCTSKSRRSPHIDLRNYVLFVDDDYYIDLDSLLLYIYNIDEDREMTTYERRIFVTGELIEKSRPQRFLNDRWYVSIIDYPYDIYPPYISTECFLMTRYNARLFNIASRYTRLFQFDHIYMGLLAYSMSINFIENNQIFSTSLISSNGFLSKLKRIFHKDNNFNSTKHPICFRGYRNQRLIDLWNQIHRTNFTFSFDL